MHAYRQARLHSQRQDAFDQLTACLGPFQAARGGFEDWRGRDVKGMQSVTAKLVEAVVRWREAKLAAGHPPIHGDGTPDPFIFGNKNVLLAIPTALDFLGEISELRYWYGAEYVFESNPFCRAAPIAERPATPPSAMVTVIIDDEKVS